LVGRRSPIILPTQISKDPLKATVDAWLAYRERNPESTSRESARELLEEKITELAGSVLI